MQKYYSAVKTHHDYVCHKCFRQIEDCTCRFYPYSLLQIDEEIQEQIRILNVDKKYCTNGSCSGHENKNPMGKEECTCKMKVDTHKSVGVYFFCYVVE